MDAAMHTLLTHRIEPCGMRLTGKRFRVRDMFQHMVGGFLLAGPFVVEGGVWEMAAAMANYQAGILVGIVLAIGYAALYKADPDRDAGAEASFLGVPVRYISLIAVSYGAVITLVVLLSGQATYGASLAVTLKVVSIAAVFSVIGAATADSVF